MSRVDCLVLGYFLTILGLCLLLAFCSVVWVFNNPNSMMFQNSRWNSTIIFQPARRKKCEEGTCPFLYGYFLKLHIPLSLSSIDLQWLTWAFLATRSYLSRKKSRSDIGEQPTIPASPGSCPGSSRFSKLTLYPGVVKDQGRVVCQLGFKQENKTIKKVNIGSRDCKDVGKAAWVKVRKAAAEDWRKSLKTSFEDTKWVVLQSFMGKLLKFSSGSGKVLTEHLSLWATTWAPPRSLERPSNLKSTHVTCQNFLKIVISFHFCLSYLLLTNSDLEQYGKGILGSVAFRDRNDAELTRDNQT